MVEALVDVCEFGVEKFVDMMAASQQSAFAAHALEHIILGRNEPTLHHYHNTYRRQLEQTPLELLDEHALSATA